MTDATLDELLRRKLATRILTAAAVLLSPIASAKAQPPQSKPSPAVSSAFLTSESVVALSLRPRQVLTNPALSLLPVEVAKAAGEKYLGIDAANIQRVIAVVEPPLGVTPYYALFLQADRDWDLTQLSPELTAHTQPGEIAGRDCLVSTRAELPCLMVLKGKTLVAASQGMLRKFLDRERPKASGVLADLVANHPSGDDLYLGIDLEKLRPLVQLGLMQAEQRAKPELKPLLEIPLLIQSAELTFNPDFSRPTRLAVHTANTTDAAKLERLLSDGLAVARTEMRANMERGLAQLRSSNDPVERAMASYADRVTQAYTDGLAPKRSGESFVLVDTGLDAAKGQQVAQVAIIGVLVALLLPAVQAARAAARRNNSQNNLKQLALALLNYESVRETFPPQAIFDGNGKPLLSWRVAILPYLDQQQLYEQFHLDEPWDSPHNRSLIPQMPAFFLDPSSRLPQTDGRSTYAAVAGPRALMNGSPKGRKLTKITDGTSMTVGLVEVSDEAAPIWTQPTDWTPTPGNPFAGLGGRHPGGFIAAMCDSSVQFLATDALDPRIWSALLTVDGGESINGN